MRNGLVILSVLILSAGGLGAQPKVTAVFNRASIMPPGTPQHGIARGSVILVSGTNLGPADPAVQSAGAEPLSTTLGGVSIQVTVGGVTTDAIPYTVTTNTVVAILRSETPAGDGTLVVKNGDQASEPFAIKVRENAFGISSSDGRGLGAVAVKFADGTAVTASNAANPGESVFIEGTGLGADAADETLPIAEPANLEVPIEVYFGKTKAEVGFRGRSNNPGWDRVEVVVPAGVEGCFVGVYAKIGTFVSNFLVLPVATTGRVCKDRGADVTEIFGAAPDKPIRAGHIGLGKTTSHTPAIPPFVPASSTASDGASAVFVSYEPNYFVNFGGKGEPEFGSCLVIVPSLSTFDLPVASAVKYLDAGPAITVTPSGGSSVTMPRAGNSYFLTTLPGRPPLIPATGGSFRFNGTGGADVGAFEASTGSITPLAWTNRAAATTIDRSKDLEITWTGGQNAAYVVILGGSSLPSPRLTTSFVCTERATAGRFTIPADVLSTLVPTTVTPGPFAISTDELAVLGYSAPGKFTAPGLDTGTVTFFSGELALVTYR